MVNPDKKEPEINNREGGPDDFNRCEEARQEAQIEEEKQGKVYSAEVKFYLKIKDVEQGKVLWKSMKQYFKLQDGCSLSPPYIKREEGGDYYSFLTVIPLEKEKLGNFLEFCEENGITIDIPFFPR